MKKVRRKCIGEFKEGVVELVTEQGYKISEAARNLGIHAIQFGRWAKEKSLSNRCGTGSVCKAACNNPSTIVFNWKRG